MSTKHEPTCPECGEKLLLGKIIQRGIAKGRKQDIEHDKTAKAVRKL